MQGQPHAQDAAAASAGDPLTAAHDAMLHDPQLQLHFSEFTPPRPPEWLQPLAEFIRAISPFLVYVFWGGVAVIVLTIAYALFAEIRRRMPAQAETPQTAAPPAPDYRPTAVRARALLEEADRLAAEGRYGEAARVLLRRSIEDFENVLKIAIGPALTSREIARLDRLSPQGRTTFSSIAAAVERSLFGGETLTASQYGECRDAYAHFALQGTRQ
ncbi:MAG: DUF4129 domain-containing protein [Proteobacteria bacterium]|nr:DUF4129 domain-containing protein [Pseudomonadota bacterium]